MEKNDISRVIIVVKLGLILLVSFASPGELVRSQSDIHGLPPSSFFDRINFVSQLKFRICFGRCKREHCDKIRVIPQNRMLYYLCGRLLYQLLSIISSIINNVSYYLCMQLLVIAAKIVLIYYVSLYSITYEYMYVCIHTYSHIPLFSWGQFSDNTSIFYS